MSNIQGKHCNLGGKNESANVFESTVHNNDESTVHYDVDKSLPLTNFKIELDKLLLSFLSQLYSIPSLPRTVIQTIVHLVTNLFTSEPNLILNKTLKSISNECSSMVSLL